MEEELYLSDYLKVLRKNWKVIVAALSVAVVVSLLLGFYLIKPRYEATVGLVLLRTKAEMAFEPRIKSLEELPNIKTLESLAKSPHVAEKALEQVGLKGVVDPFKLLKTLRVRSDGDYLSLSVRHPDPRVAKELANAMGEIVEQEANVLFVTGGVPLEELEAELEEAKRRYEEAQRCYDEFLGQSPLPFYQRELELKEGLLSDLYGARRRMARVLSDLESLRVRLEAKDSVTQGDALSEAFLNLYASTAFSSQPAVIAEDRARSPTFQV